jgi:tetratricopeptide (TPR) repeat protein
LKSTPGSDRPAPATSEKNRADLLPLLKSAQLEADRNQPAEATRLFAEILAVEPDWSDALDAQFWFLITQGDHAFNHATLAAAGGYFQAAETVVQRLLKTEPDAPRSQGDLSVSLERLGNFLATRGQPGDAEKALNHFQRCLELCEGLLRDNPQSAQAAQDVSVSLMRLGEFLATRGQPGDAEKALDHYQRSLKLGVRWPAFLVRKSKARLLRSPATSG